MRVAIVSHPTDDDTAMVARWAAAGGTPVVIRPVGAPGCPGVETIHLAVLGKPGSRMIRYVGLRAALAGADVVRVHANPGTALAWQSFGAGRRPASRPAFVLEADHCAGRPLPFVWRLAARRVLARADAVITRHADGLARLRRGGFEGLGFVSGAGPMVTPLRRDRAIGPLTVGLATTELTPLSGAVEVLEAVAASADTILVVVATRGHARLADRAAALDVLDRLRFVAAEELLPQIDVLVAVPHVRAGYRFPYDRLIDAAQAAAIPVVCSKVAGLPEVVGSGGWVVPAHDAGALFEVFRTRLQDRQLLDRIGERAVIHQRTRQIEALDENRLSQIVEAAARSRHGAGRRPASTKANRAAWP